MAFKDISGIIALVGVVFTAGVVFTSMRNDIEKLKNHSHEKSAVTIPANSVLAFNLASCPNGWKEFAPAYGQFIRGVDRGATKIDPDGERAIGNIQEGSIQKHSHVVTHWTGPGKFQRHTLAHTKYTNQTTAQGGGKSGEEGGKETRPKNIALLYCYKI